MIETGQELIDGYSASFRSAGGDPDSCEGVIWAKRVVGSDGQTSADDIIDDIGKKIDDGTADHGWLIGILKHCWADISEDKRLRIFALLKPGGALKGLVNRNVFPPLTDSEKAFLTQAFEESRSVAALRRLNG